MNWLELLDERGEVVGRRPADALPCGIGRAVTNALVSRAGGVEDHHAELVESGKSILVLDLGTPAGLRTSPDGPRLDRAELRPGTVLFLGSARIRLTAAPEPVHPRSRGIATIAAWADRPSAKRAAPLVLLAAAAGIGWLVSTDDDPFIAGLMVGGAALTLEAVWAGGWSLINRLRYGRARFAQHFTVGVVASAAALVLGEAAGWIEFLNPGGTAAVLASFVTIALLWWLALRLHLTVMVPDGSRRSHRLTAATALLLGGCFAWMPRVEAGGFDAIAEFGTELKPVPRALVPAQDPARFRASLQELKSALLAEGDSLTLR
jgi:hypothetical protein